MKTKQKAIRELNREYQRLHGEEAPKGWAESVYFEVLKIRAKK